MASVAKPPESLADVIHHAVRTHLQDRHDDKEEHPQDPPIAKPPVEDVDQFVRDQDAREEDDSKPWHDARSPGGADGKKERVQDGGADHSDSPGKADKGKQKERPLTEVSKHSPNPSYVPSHRATKSNGDSRAGSKQLSMSSQRGMTQGTPQERTGPPRSISYNYSLSSAVSQGEDPDHSSEFPPSTSPFRGAYEYENPDHRDRKHKRRESYFHASDVFNPLKWISESPKASPTEEKNQFDFSAKAHTDGSVTSQNDEREAGPSHSSTPGRDPKSLPRLRKPSSLPQINADARSPITPKWGRLRSLIPHIAKQQQAPAHSSVVSANVNITDELITGGLATLMLRLWFERDEKGHRKVPALFHRLRIRVSDSLHPMHGGKAVFRIECEYANGAVRWVVYRQLREFVSLHGHYTLSNAYNRNLDDLPDFPKTTLPYFKFLKQTGNDVTHADFARMQRETLENYLIGLIRAVMFHPSANRLAGFLEFGALTIALAQSGGAQYKAGLLSISTVAPKGNFGRKASGWREKKRQKWCAVRESYLVVMEEMGELKVWDVFLIDQDFKIERPTRYYRQGLHLLHLEDGDNDDENVTRSGKEPAGPEPDPEPEVRQPRRRLASTVGSIKHTFNKTFRSGGHLDVPQPHHKGHSDSNLAPGRASNNRRYSSSSSGSSSSGPSSRPLTPMLDPSTNTNPLDGEGLDKHHDPAEALNDKKKKNSKDVSKHTFYVENSQLRLKLVAKNERQMLQWIAALERVARESHYTGKNRFDSFAPIRLNVAAQWLVDGRDYFWNLSRALLLARESIMIHDWWLSPELQMRRPNKSKYRLDNLLEQKAKEGVKIYIILYQEVSSRTTPVDSNYAKQRLTALHPNVMVQRSPSHFQTGTFYWAHHEKLCVIDQAIAFMGGLDHCFGRWDTPQHVLIDDPEGGEDPIWPGKDYSNPRVGDFHTLNKPHDDMYDRSKVPRMPWHDVSMQVVGQPARDLARHFVQRWNHLLRIKNHSRAMPFLLPPPEFRPGELSQMGLTGTCELQICRSGGPWSLGTPERTEFSIQNAYLKAIQLSEHFVYIENQFFITSTVVNEVKIENRIGDAIVHRIIRAHREGTPWKCCIIIPLLPGFSFPVDHSDASAIRIILECQNRTICRGPNSIFGRLRKEGIDPDNYITIFSLRNWAKLRGDVLVSEQVYIHGKVCIVDDRLAIIGSANINERSQRGDRDSEIAAVIRDTDMLDGSMAGKPFKVGRFAHSLRVRLMREHLGVDVDAMYEEDLMASEPVKEAHEQDTWDPENEQEFGREDGVTHKSKREVQGAMSNLFTDTASGVAQAIHAVGEDLSKDAANLLKKAGVANGNSTAVGDQYLQDERMMYSRDGEKKPGFPSAIVPTIEEQIVDERRPRAEQREGGTPILDALDRQGDSEASQAQNGSAANGDGDATGANSDPPEAEVETGELYGAPADASVDEKHDDQPPHARAKDHDADEAEEKAPGARSVLRKHLAAKVGTKPWTLPTPTPKVDPKGFDDPICDDFWKDVWLGCAVHNTEIFRKVFHAIPDDLVTTWKQYKEFIVHHERLNQPAINSDNPEPVARVPSEAGDPLAPGQANVAEKDMYAKEDEAAREREHADESEKARETPTPPPPTPSATDQSTIGKEKEKDAQKDKRPQQTKGPKGFDQAEREEMEALLREVRGHLVLYPTRFLEGEDVANNFLFPSDRLLPLPIYD